MADSAYPIADMWRKFRGRPASMPMQYVQQYLQLGPITVGAAVIPFTPNRVPATLVLVQAAQTNAGTISIGGMNLSFANGIQITAGQAAVYTVDMSNMKVLAESVSTGVAAGMEILQGYQARGVERPPTVEIVLLLNQLFAVANAAGQQFSVTYTQLVRL